MIDNYLSQDIDCKVMGQRSRSESSECAIQNVMSYLHNRSSYSLDWHQNLSFTISYKRCICNKNLQVVLSAISRGWKLAWHRCFMLPILPIDISYSSYRPTCNSWAELQGARLCIILMFICWLWYIDLYSWLSSQYVAIHFCNVFFKASR